MKKRDQKESVQELRLLELVLVQLHFLARQLRRFEQASVLPQRFHFIQLFPGEIRVVASEMAVRRCFPEDGPPEVQCLDDGSRLQRKMLSHQLCNLFLLFSWQNRNREIT